MIRCESHDFAGQLAPARRDDASFVFDFVFDPERTRIHQDRAQFVIDPAGATEQQQAGLRRDRDADFIGDDETIAADEFLFGQERADESFEANAQLVRHGICAWARCAAMQARCAAGNDCAAV